MNFEQIYSKAESECSYLNDRDCVKIYVSSLMNDLKAQGVFDRFQAEIDKNDINAKVIKTGSLGYYDLEPLVVVEKTGQSSVLYNNVTPEKASELVNDYVTNEKVCRRCLFKDGVKKVMDALSATSMSFFHHNISKALLEIKLKVSAHSN